MPIRPDRKTSLPRFPSDEGRMIMAINAAKSAAARLSDKTILIVQENGPTTWRFMPSANMKAVMSLLESEESREKKINELINMRVLISDKELTSFDYNGWLDGLLDDFLASDQLHERLAGTWEKPEKPDLPTGLVQLPAFAKVDVPQPDPPEGDFDADLLGWMRSEPVVSGYVFIDGVYVDPPYVVEQRGNVLIINNRICENAPDKPLVFATFAPAVRDELPAGHWNAPPSDGTDPFSVTLEGDDDRRIMLRMQALYYQVTKYLLEGGIVIAEDKHLRALHKRSWYNTWKGTRQWEMIAYRWSPEYSVKTFTDLFIPVTGNTYNPDEEEVETAIKRYGKFLTEYKITPGFFIRWAGGDVWTDFLESATPDQPSGIIQPPAIKETK